MLKLKKYAKTEKERFQFIRIGKEMSMDIKLNYIEKGQGTPLILLHGNGENLEYFSAQIDYFSKKYHVVAIDTRGHGKSERGTKEFSLVQFSEDLKEFLDEKKLNKIDLLGFSDGGNIALLFALKYPEYLNKLILNGADLHPSGVKRRYQIPIILFYCFLSIISIVDKRKINKKEMFRLMVTQPDIKPEELEAIHVPTLVIAGTKDMIKQNHTECISAHIKNSQLSIIEGNHFIAKKNSCSFNERLEKFLNE